MGFSEKTAAQESGKVHVWDDLGVFHGFVCLIVNLTNLYHNGNTYEQGKKVKITQNQKICLQN